MTLELTPEELKVLNEVVRTHKITASTEELYAVVTGKANSPLLSLLHKVGMQWEETKKQIEEATKQATTKCEAVLEGTLD